MMASKESLAYCKFQQASLVLTQGFLPPGLAAEWRDTRTMERADMLLQMGRVKMKLLLCPVWEKERETLTFAAHVL